MLSMVEIVEVTVVGLTVERVEGLLVVVVNSMMPNSGIKLISSVERVVGITVERVVGITVERVVGLTVETVLELSPYLMQATPSSASSRAATFPFLHLHLQNSSHSPGLEYLAAFVNDVKVTKIMTMSLKSTVKQEDFVKFRNWRYPVMK